MTLKERINALVSLGEKIREDDERMQACMQRTHMENQWFTIENIKQSKNAIAQHFLQKDLLENWVNNYHLDDNIEAKKVALILAGNIPLVGFHDVLCVFICGHISQIKISKKDPFLLPFFLKILSEIDPRTKDYFELTEKISNFDAVIATGSNNSSRYFETYFGKYPNIIRKNRNAVAVINGDESKEDFDQLGKDIFNYYGMGCRNVSKVYLPKDYDLQPLLESLHEFKHIVTHSKYKNNFDYNLAIFMLNQIPVHSNGCLMLVEDKALTSRIACLHYEFYENDNTLNADLIRHKEEIQCIVSKKEDLELKTVPFGQAQQPSLTDYADGLDTINFLLSL